MIDFPRTKEGYAEFLQTGFWKDLTTRKKALVGHCERCGSTRFLESHHIYYPPVSWFDTTLGMLKVLCRGCHRAEHGFAAEPKASRVVPAEFSTMEQLIGCRAKRLIDRATFKRWKQILRNRGVRKVNASRRRRKRPRYYVGKDGLMHRTRKKRVQIKNQIARGLNFSHRKNWVNRGTSSN